MSVISSVELTTRATQIVTDRIFQAILLKVGNAPVNANSPYQTLIAYEVPNTAGGYSRLEFDFNNTDIIETATGASTATRFITWVHNGNSESIEFDSILIVERVFAQPLSNYYNVALHSLGLVYTLVNTGDRARFAFRVNVKNK